MIDRAPLRTELAFLVPSVQRMRFVLAAILGVDGIAHFVGFVFSDGQQDSPLSWCAVSLALA